MKIALERHSYHSYSFPMIMNTMHMLSCLHACPIFGLLLSCRFSVKFLTRLFKYILLCQCWPGRPLSLFFEVLCLIAPSSILANEAYPCLSVLSPLMRILPVQNSSSHSPHFIISVSECIYVCQWCKSLPE